MSIHNSLISTALLALQTAGDARFTMNCALDNTSKSGFWWKAYANEEQDDETQCEILVYMTPESPTGYALQVDVLDDEAYTIFDKNIETFQQFQLIFATDYLDTVYKNK